jgi:hypothetical protein
MCTTLDHTNTRRHTFEGLYIMRVDRASLFLKSKAKKNIFHYASFMRLFFMSLSSFSFHLRTCLLGLHETNGIGACSSFHPHYDHQLQPSLTCILNRDNSIRTYPCVYSLVFFLSRLPPSFATARSAFPCSLLRSSSFTISFII